MGLLGFAAELERRVFGFFRGLFGGGSAPHQLEMRQGILDDVERRVQPVGDGRRAFPYDRVVVHVRAEDEDRRYLIESAFVERNKLKNDIAERLRQAGAQVPAGLGVEVRFADESDATLDARGFRVEYARRRAGRRPAARFTVTRGAAEEPTVVMTRSNLNVGRMRDVKDVRDLIVRRNDLVFHELDDEVNGSVSRAHAHVWYDEKEGVFRLCDDNSAQGTSVFRDGRTLEVHRNSPRGVRLRDADEIYFGRAVVRFELLPEEPPAEEHRAGAKPEPTGPEPAEPEPAEPEPAESGPADLQTTLSAEPHPHAPTAEEPPNLSDAVELSAPQAADVTKHAEDADVLVGENVRDEGGQDADDGPKQ